MPKFRDSLISPNPGQDVHVHLHLDEEVAVPGYTQVPTRDAAPDLERSIERYFARNGLGDPPHVVERRERLAVAHVHDAACGCAKVVDFRSSAIHAGASARIRDTNFEKLVAEIWAGLPPGGK